MSCAEITSDDSHCVHWWDDDGPCCRCCDDTRDDEQTECRPAVQRMRVLWPFRRSELALYADLRCPRYVPFDFVSEHRAQCLKNHGQTPERLNERGGLSPDEMVAVIRDRRWVSMRESEAIEELKVSLRAWLERTADVSLSRG